MNNITFDEIKDNLSLSKQEKLQTTVNGICELCKSPFTVGFYNLFRKKDYSQICHKCKLSVSKKAPVLSNFVIKSDDDLLKLKNDFNNCNCKTSYYNTTTNYTCENCGKEVSISTKSFVKHFTLKCSSCLCMATSMERYGVRTAFSLSGVQEKARRNNILNNGGIGLASDTVKQKVYDTNRQKYGFDNPLHSGTTSFDKKNKTILEKYGVSNVFELEQVKDKIKSTNIEKYGVDNPSKSNSIIQKIKGVMLDRYGVESYTHTMDYINSAHKKYTYDGITFDSSWEVALWIYAIDNNIPIRRNPCKFEYTWDNATHIYFPDFEFNGELVEIKGDQFFDSDGKMCCPYDHSKDGIFEAKHQCMLKNGVKILRNKDILPYMDFVENKYTKDYIPLFRNGLAFPYINENLKDKSDMGLIHHFHKSIYEATRKGKLSPLLAWDDKSIIKKVALNRLKYVGKCRPSDIVQGFNVTKIAAKVSVFKPKFAEYLINKYLSENKQIFDPFSGFSGRLLGAYNCGRSYIGQDINIDHVRESNEIIDYKGILNASVTVKDILESEGEYECLFTCPPYGGKEHWNENNDEIEKSCDEWIDECLKRFKCKSYLFVVDKTDKYKDYIVESITNESHFGSNNEYVVFLKY